jgi:hypothetical protein
MISVDIEALLLKRSARPRGIFVVTKAKLPAGGLSFRQVSVGLRGVFDGGPIGANLRSFVKGVIEYRQF